MQRVNTVRNLPNFILAELKKQGEIFLKIYRRNAHKSIKMTFWYKFDLDFYYNGDVVFRIVDTNRFALDEELVDNIMDSKPLIRSAECRVYIAYSKLLGYAQQVADEYDLSLKTVFKIAGLQGEYEPK